MVRESVLRETAAAAIAVRGEPGSLQVCLVSTPEGQWSVPWALIGKGEVPKQTALRALHEAAGIKPGLGDVDRRFYRTIEQSYRRGADKVRREVHVYRVRAAPEPDAGQWVPAHEALEKVTSKAVREALEEALGGDAAKAPG